MSQQLSSLSVGKSSNIVLIFKQKTAYEIGVRLVGSEMCIRDSCSSVVPERMVPRPSRVVGGASSSSASKKGSVKATTFPRFHLNPSMLHHHAWRLSSAPPEPQASHLEWLSTLRLPEGSLL